MNASEISEDKVGLRKKGLLETKLATSALDRADSAQNPDLFTSSTQPTESNLASAQQAMLETWKRWAHGRLTRKPLSESSVLCGSDVTFDPTWVERDIGDFYIS